MNERRANARLFLLHAGGVLKEISQGFREAIPLETRSVIQGTPEACRRTGTPAGVHRLVRHAFQW